ncbi:MAG: hypothetical protein MUC91_09555 [Verrucomicrobia bacterium]|nr:hypothetical protein [Verrucomicrobiota bacterium]
MRIDVFQTRWGWPARAVFLSGCLLVAVGSVAQQFPAGMFFKDFSLPQNYGPPHETRMKSLLQGAEAVSQEGGGILIQKLKLQTFREDGAGEFVLQADTCLYDPKLRNASSPGPLEMRTADGRFSTAGEGFLWREAESRLIISNRVHTVILTGGKRSDNP